MDHTTARLRSVRCRAEQFDARALADPGLVRRTPMPGNDRVLVLERTEAGDALRAAGARHLGDSERDQLRHVLDPLLEVAS